MRYRLAVILLSVLLSSCSALTVRPQEPTVTVSAVRPISIGFARQELGLTLLIENPNAFALPVRSLDFVALLGDEPLAEGASDTPVVVPANGEAELEVSIVLGLADTLGRIGQRLGRGNVDLGYRVTGSVKLDNWPARLPFDVDGTLR